MYLAPDAPHYDIPILECRICDTTFGKIKPRSVWLPHDFIYVGRVMLLDKILGSACFPAADTSSFRIQVSGKEY